MEHARWEELFPNSFDVFQIKFELTVQWRLLYSGSAYTIDSLIHEWLELIFHVIFQQFLCLASSLKQSFSQVVTVQVDNNVGGSLDVWINQAFLNIAFSLS